MEDYESLKNEIEKIGIQLEKINKSMVQARYYHSQKGQEKLKRQNETRRNRTKFKKVIKELNNRN